MSIEGIRKGYLFRANGILKGKELDLEAEPPLLNIFEFLWQLSTTSPDQSSEKGPVHTS